MDKHERKATHRDSLLRVYAENASEHRAMNVGSRARSAPSLAPLPRA